MARITNEARKAANRKSAIAPALAEAEHFHVCAECGELVDRRNLGDVIHHETPGHDARPCEPAPAVLRFVPPMLPSLVDQPPEGDEWIHEIKYDGYRTQIHVSGGRVRAYTRNAHDWTERYGPVVRAVGELRCSSAILDGEVIVQDDQGRSDFHALTGAIHRTPARLVFVAWDLLHVNGENLQERPLMARREALETLLGSNSPECPLQFSADLTGSGADFLAAVDAIGLEGIVSKKRRSRYTSGRTKAWLKTKNFEEGDFLLVGVEREKGRPAMALLAKEDHGELTYAGGAAVTLKEAERDRFWRSVEDLATEAPAVKIDRKAAWVQPRLRVRARYLRSEERLRHSTLTGLL
ncbi:non-homologous end-joining DNA ligase [Tsuneonella sp. HG249]